MTTDTCVETIGLVAAITEVDADGESIRFSGVLVIEGERTTDGREIAEGALSWRTLPIPLTNSDDTMDDHGGPVVGKITAITRSGNELRFEGEFDIGSDDGREAARLVTEQVKRWVSIDLEIIEHELLEEGNCDDPFSEDCKMILRVIEGRVMGAAIVAFPAFPAAVIIPEGAELSEGDENGRPEALAACAGPAAPPADWFAVPEADEPTPLHIGEDGQVYGHAFVWESCHTGYASECKLAPREGDYSFFLTGEVVCEDGSRVPVGQLTVGCGHPVHSDGTPDLTLTAREAMAHYDGGPGAIQFADVTITAGKYGGWVCGALRSDVTPDVIRAARAQAPSGDWRPVGGALRLVALTMVPVPGFPVPRSVTASGAFSSVNTPQGPAVRMRNGKPVALVAAGRMRPHTLPLSLEARLSNIERMMQAFEPGYREMLLDTIRGAVT